MFYVVGAEKDRDEANHKANSNLAHFTIQITYTADILGNYRKTIR